MAIDERARHQLYQRLEETLGAEPATTLMEHLPPTGWADVATKSDLAALERSTKSDISALEERLELRFERIDDRFDRIDAQFAAVDDRFAGIDGRFSGIDGRFESLEERIDLKMRDLENRLLAAFRGEILNAVTSQTRPFIISIISMFVLFATYIAAIKFV